MHQIVASQSVFENQRAAVAGFCGHCDCRVSLPRWCEIQIGSYDVGVFARKHEVQVLVIAFEQCHVFGTVAVCEVEYLGFLYYAAFGVEGQLHFLVLQYNLLVYTVHRRVKQRCGVALRGSQSLCFLRYLCYFLVLVGFLFQYCGYRVLFALCFNLFLCRLVVPTEHTKYGEYQNESDNVVLIHLFCF